MAVIDSAGLTIVHTPATVLESLPALEFETLTTVGGETEDGFLVAVTSVHRFADGRLAILDAGNRHVLFADADGTVTRTLGRDGDGPGEFRSPSRMFPLPGDSLLVVDGGTGRITVIGPDGEVGRTAPLESGPGGGLPIGMLDDGTLAHASPQGGAAERMESSTPVMQHGFVRLYAPDGTLADSIGPFPDHATYAIDRGYTSPIFSSRTDFAPWGDGVWVGTGLGAELLKVRRDGSVERTVRWDSPAWPVTQEDRDRLLEVNLERAGPGTDPAEIRRFHEVALFASQVPPYRRIFTDVTTGAVWVEGYDLTYGQEPTEWMVFSAEGRPVGRVDLPAGFRFWEANDGVVSGVVFDELQVPSVVVLRVEGL